MTLGCGAISQPSQSSWADWKPTASVCIEIIYHQVIKVKAFVGGITVMYDVVFGNSIFIQNILSKTCTVGPDK